MTPRRRNLVVGGLVAGTALGAGAFVAARVLKRSPEADALENARFVDLQGKPRTLTEWRGKVVVANFWATWCAPCLEEIPLLVAIRRAYAQKMVEVVGIAIDQAAKVQQFAAKMQIDYPILLAETQGVDLIRTLGNRSGGLPFTVFLDRAGTPARTKIGVLRQPELDSVLAALVSS
jgi:thiol-disulfide isomerase/thioredoxin